MNDRNIFIDTHVHTVHSELDGMIKLEEYIGYGKKNNFPALFISDHGNISGWIPFYTLCVDNNIKPILGSEFYFSEGLVSDDLDDDTRKKNQNNFHLNIYAKNKIGYKNIIKLTTYANMENFYRKPRITFDILKKYSEGLIVTTSCVGSIFSYYINNDKPEIAHSYLLKFKELFGEDFYIEYGYHYFDNEKKYIEKLRRFSKELNIKTIIGNDAHYLNKEDELAHKILMCKGEQTILDKSNFNYSDNYYKSYTDICTAFAEFGGIDIDECMNNTFEIIDKVEDYGITFGNYIMPELKDTNGLSQDEYLKKLIQEGVKKRFNNNLTKEQLDRIKYEFSVIKEMKFSGYFNVVSDYLNWCKNNGIPVGPARGSGAGSMINYVIGITDVEPIKYGLLFERFLNPERKGFPDIDSDVETSRRPDVIKHLTEQYGQKCCVPISTRAFLKGKSSIKAVASKLGLDFTKYNKLLSHIKDPSLDTVEKVINSSDELLQKYENDTEFKKVVDIAKKIEGSVQSISVHASAVCIELEDISNHIPIIKTKDGYATGWTDKIVEKCGLIKYDLLGLSNLSVIQQCCDLIGDGFDINNIPLDDPKTYKDLQDGDNLGKFQIESQGMKNLLKRLKPETIEHISAILALYRPGAMQFIDEYIAGKNNPSEVKYFDPRVEPILKSTYGQIVYQEQVMNLAKTLAGYTMGEADVLRKAIGKKNMQEMLNQQNKFVDGCVKNGMDKDKALTLFEQIVEFAKYSFNSSHSVAYSFITYRTAYLKSNYPVQFMCALLNCNSDDLDKLNLYIGECFRLGVPILPPDINISNENFTIDNDGKIRFGLSAIKGLGKSAVSQIINTRKNRPFTSIEDFIDRTSKVDKSNIQSLLKVGAFNNIEPNPKRWDKLCDYINDAKKSKEYNGTANLDRIIYNIIGTKKAKKSDKYLDLQQQKRELGSSKKSITKKEELNEQQENIIRNYCDTIEKYYLQFTKYTPAEKIESEQELLGFNISTNPYQRWDKFKKIYSKNNTSIPFIELTELLNNPDKYLSYKNIHTVALLHDIKEIKTKKGDRMAKITLDYFGHKISTTVFSSQWQNNLENKIQKGNLVAITGRLLEANKQFSIDDYEFKLDTMRQLNVLVNENNKCIIDKDKFDYNTVVEKIRIIASKERQEFLPVERVVMFKCENGKFNILDGIYWINNPEKLTQFL